MLIVRPPGGKLTWLRAMSSRRAAAITAILSFFTGILITDGYTAYQQMLTDLAGIQQCAAHVIRRCRAVSKLGPGSLQSWATRRDHHPPSGAPGLRGRTVPRPTSRSGVIDNLRERYDEAVAFGITHNRHRDWHDGNHPGYALGNWLRGYADQVWLFTSQPAVEWTNDLASHCTSWVCSAVSGLSWWSGRAGGVVFSVAWGTDIFRQRAAEVGVVAAA